jgi:hypothetical protein
MLQNRARSAAEAVALAGAEAAVDVETAKAGARGVEFVAAEVRGGIRYSISPPFGLGGHIIETD